MRKIKDANVWKSNTVVAQILRIFEKSEGATVQAKYIVDELPDIDYDTVYSTLARLARKGRIERVGFGLYKLRVRE